MALVKTDMNFDLGFTPLLNAFVDKYMIKANHTYSIVYIYSFRNCFSGNKKTNTTEIAETLNILESDVCNAFNFWEKEKLISIVKIGDDLEIEFLNIDKDFAVKPEIINIKPVVNLATKPVYENREIEVYQNDNEEIRNLFKIAEKELGKHLSHNDLSTLFSFYDWLRLPIDVIENLLAYCVGNNHKGMRYIETVAIDWSENNINTVEAAKEYVNKFNNVYRNILKAFGITNRNPSTREIEYMDRWLDEYEMPLNLILEACDKTIINIGNASFHYANTIIANWHAKNVKTIDDMKKLDADFTNTQNKKEGLPKREAFKSTRTAKKNKIVNYKNRSWDYEKLEKLELERNMKETKES